MNVNHNEPTRQADAVNNPKSEPGSDSPISWALRTQESFTRAQVADLIRRAFQSGYEHAQLDAHDAGFWLGYQTRSREWNDWAVETVTTVTMRDQRDGAAFGWLREQRDMAARLPRLGDHPGGPVPMWGDESARPLRVVA